MMKCGYCHWVCAFAMLFLGIGSGAFACGLHWDEPKSRFNGVDFQGHPHLVEKIGELESDTGTPLKLPIYVIFNASYGKSPYLGSNFEIPLLESRIWQSDENSFIVKSPSGWLGLLRRDGGDESLLSGAPGVKAEIKDDTVTIWSSCGDKVTYVKGRIVQMQYKNHVFDYVYSGDRVSEVQEAGKTLLKVESDSGSGYVTGLSFNGQHVGIEQADKPQVQVIGSRKLVGGLDKSLKKLMLSDKSIQEFDFAVDKQMNPTVNVFISGKERLFTWDPTNKLILEDRGESQDWKYNIRPASDDLEYAEISRTNEKGQNEYWFHDDKAGKNYFTGTDGTSKTIVSFTSGILAGKLRSMEEKKDGKTISNFNIDYDEAGRPIRTMLNNKIIREEFYPSTNGWDSSLDPAFKAAEPFIQKQNISSVVAVPSSNLYAFYDADNHWVGNLNSQMNFFRTVIDSRDGKEYHYLDNAVQQVVTRDNQKRVEEIDQYSGNVLKTKELFTYEVDSKTGNTTIQDQIINEKNRKSLSVVKIKDSEGRLLDLVTPDKKYQYTYDIGGRKDLSITNLRKMYDRSDISSILKSIQ